MSASRDLIDIDLLLNARTTGMTAFNEAEGALGGIGKAAIGAAAAFAAFEVAKELIKDTVAAASECPHDLAFVFGASR